MADIEGPGDKIKRLMRESAPASNVADFAAAARKRGRPVASTGPAVQIRGDGNIGIAGDANAINITVKGPRQRRPKVQVTRGPNDITEAQAAEIRELVAKVVAVSGMPHQRVWYGLGRKFRFSSYRLIPAADFEAVRSYLRRWIASASAPSDPSPSAARNRALRRIHAEAKKVPGMIDQVHAFIHGRFGTQSLSDLTVGQLDEVIRQFNF